VVVVVVAAGLRLPRQQLQAAAVLRLPRQQLQQWLKQQRQHLMLACLWRRPRPRR
jgi:hypothetical protein